MKWNICSIDKIDNDVAKLFLCSSSNSSRTTVGYAVYEDIDDALKMVNVNDIERNFCIFLCLKKDGKKIRYDKRQISVRLPCYFSCQIYLFNHEFERIKNMIYTTLYAHQFKSAFRIIHKNAPIFDDIISIQYGF